MTIPKGATHVDVDGDYWRYNGVGYAFYKCGCFRDYIPEENFIGYRLIEVSNPYQRGKPEYHGQFEPWQPNTYVEAGMPDVGVKAAETANRAIKDMMR